MNVRIYHNPRCGKSRDTLKLLRSRGVEPEVIEYLKTPPDADTLRALIARLGIAGHELLRKKQQEYKTLGLGPQPDDETAIEAMVREPILMERPVVVAGERAVIGRPPERVLELLG